MDQVFKLLAARLEHRHAEAQKRAVEAKRQEFRNLGGQP
jgi:hypothetical protein